jgi:hypothetical protein
VASERFPLCDVTGNGIDLPCSTDGAELQSSHLYEPSRHRYLFSNLTESARLNASEFSLSGGNIVG